MDGDTTIKTTGGIHTLRGMLYQTYSLMFYWLKRAREYPDMEVMIETVEDATFVYPNSTAEGLSTIELVQCKKAEDSESPSVYLGVGPIDRWQPASCDISDLRRWTSMRRSGYSTQEELKKGNHYFTVLLFGEPTTTLRRFIPTGMQDRTPLSWYAADFSHFFPPTYRHSKDPLPGKALASTKFASAEIRQKIRLLTAPAPGEIHLQTELLLMMAFGVESRDVTPAVRKLYNLVLAATASKQESGRRLTTGEIQNIVAALKTEHSGWISLVAARGAGQGLGERHTSFVSEPHLVGDSVSHAQAAWEGLSSDGFVTLCGPIGTGKTTLARYLALKFLKQAPDQRVYYLSPRVGAFPFDREKEFLRSRLSTGNLFIIDDQQRAPVEVEDLISLFFDFYEHGQTTCRLIVTSTTTYARPQALGTASNSLLNRAVCIPVLPSSPDILTAALAELRKAGAFSSPLLDNDLAVLAEGNLGLGLLLAHCTAAMPTRQSWTQALTHPRLRSALRDWLLTSVGKSGRDQLFIDQLMPILIVLSYDIPTHEHGSILDAAMFYRDGIDLLERGGHITLGAFGYGMLNPKLGIILAQQYRDQQKDIIIGYFTRSPQVLPSIAYRLAENEFGSRILRVLLSRHRDLVRETILSFEFPLSLDEIATTLTALLKVDRDLAKDALKELAFQRGRFNPLFLRQIISSGRVVQASSLRRFLLSVHRIDRNLCRRAIETPDNVWFIGLVIALLQNEQCDLEVTGSLLSAINRSSPSVAGAVFDRLVKNGTLAKRYGTLASDPRAPALWLRYIEYIKPISPSASLLLAKQRLRLEDIECSLLRLPRLYRLSFFLLRLRRLVPRLAATLLDQLWNRRRSELADLLRAEADLNALVGDILVVWRLNRRVASALVLEVQEHMEELIQAKDSYEKVAATLDVLHGSVGWRVANNLAVHIDRDRLLLLAQREHQRIALVGRFLATFATVLPDLADWFYSHLDFSQLERRITRRKLFNWVHLLHGMIRAATAKGPSSVIAHILDDPTTLNLIRAAWEEPKTPTEMAYALTLLLSTERITSTELLKIFSIPTLQALVDEMVRSLVTERSLIHHANGLYGLAQVTPIGARRAAWELLGHSELLGSSPPLASTSELRRQLAQATDLVEIGALLSVATVIDKSIAVELASSVDLGRCISVAEFEPNLGRLAIFLSGLRSASRSLSLDFVNRGLRQEILEMQFDENEEIENVLHFVHALSRTSRSAAAGLMTSIAEKRRHVVIEELKGEVNVSIFAGWLKAAQWVNPESIRQEVVGELCNSATSAMEWDTRLRHILDLTEAAIEAGDVTFGRRLAEVAIRERAQLGGIRTLTEWIVAFHKALRIERDAEVERFTAELFAGVSDLQLRLLLANGSVLVSSYVVNLFFNDSPGGCDKIAQSVRALRSSVLSRVKEDTDSIHQVAGLILCRAGIEEIGAASRRVRLRPWEMGLLNLLYQSDIEPGATLFSPDEVYGTNEAAVTAILPHATNVEFGLIMRGLGKAGVESVGSVGDSEARSADEVRGAVKWLLVGEGNIDAQHSYYKWQLLKETILRIAYLDWERDLEETIDNDVFERRTARNSRLLLANVGFD